MLRDVLLLQRREIEQGLQERYVERDVAPGRLSHDLVNVITGPRRAGKSFSAMHAVRDLGPFGHVNFDDERLTGEDSKGRVFGTSVPPVRRGFRWGPYPETRSP